MKGDNITIDGMTVDEWVKILFFQGECKIPPMSKSNNEGE